MAVHVNYDHSSNITLDKTVYRRYNIESKRDSKNTYYRRFFSISAKYICKREEGTFTHLLGYGITRNPNYYNNKDLKMSEYIYDNTNRFQFLWGKNGKRLKFGLGIQQVTTKKRYSKDEVKMFMMFFDPTEILPGTTRKDWNIVRVNYGGWEEYWDIGKLNDPLYDNETRCIKLERKYKKRAI